MYESLRPLFAFRVKIVFSEDIKYFKLYTWSIYSYGCMCQNVLIFSYVKIYVMPKYGIVIDILHFFITKYYSLNLLLFN
jgi:hypothetical protein